MQRICDRCHLKQDKKGADSLSFCVVLSSVRTRQLLREISFCVSFPQSGLAAWVSSLRLSSGYGFSRWCFLLSRRLLFDRSGLSFLFADSRSREGFLICLTGSAVVVVTTGFPPESSVGADWP